MGSLAGSFWKGEHKGADAVEGYHVPGTLLSMTELGPQSNPGGRGSPTPDR